MVEQNAINLQWHERKRIFTKDILPYLRYMSQSGFPAFLSLIGIVCIIQYVTLINNVPPALPISWIGAVALTPFLCYSPLRTYLKEADLIFLMPAEHSLSTYLALSKRRSLRYGILLLAVVLLIFWPLYRQSEGYIGLWLIPVLLLLKPLNSYFAWQERCLSWNNRRIQLRLLRWVLMFVVLLAWLTSRAVLLTLVLTFGSIGLLYVLYQVSEKFVFPWLRLIDEEKSTLRRLFSFFNLFIDVQGAAPVVRHRRYLAGFISIIPYKQAHTFTYLHMITFVRTEVGGICIRLLLLGGVVNYLLAVEQGIKGWGVVISFILFGLLLSMQVGTLRKTHRHAIWKDIFPLQVDLQHRQLITVERVLNTVLLVLLLLPTLPMWREGLIQLIVILAFLLIYPWFRGKRLAVALKREDEF